MKIDYEIIRAAFPGKAWVYAEGLDAVKITVWDGCKIADAPREEYLTHLRVFDSKRELKFEDGHCRDTALYDGGGFIPELTETRYYYVYGEQAEVKDGITVLSEERGGGLVFPMELTFPKTKSLPDGAVGLKLGIRNYVRYNPIPVLLAGEKYDFGLIDNLRGAIDVIDYAYTGFFYADGKAVEL